MKTLNEKEMAKVEGGGPITALLTLVLTLNPALALQALFTLTI